MSFQLFILINGPRIEAMLRSIFLYRIQVLTLVYNIEITKRFVDAGGKVKGVDREVSVTKDHLAEKISTVVYGVGVSLR